MVVTEIAELSANRCKVYIDQEFAFVLYKGELRRFHLTVDREIQESDYREIMQEVLPKRAKLRAMNLLQKKRYTERQLEDKLREGLYPEDMIAEAIAYVKSFHYLDDLQLAVDYITYHEAEKSRRKLVEDLRRKGINAEVISRAFETWQSLGGSQNEEEMIRAILNKKKYTPDCDDKEKCRIYAFLLRKGFTIDKVSKALHMSEI